MRAQAIKRFGDPLVFESIDIPKPQIKPGYVLVKVHATSVNPIDYKLRSGMFPDMTPDFPSILHGDVAGVVEEIGAGVTNFEVGDEIFGCAGGLKGEGGALGEWMLVDARLIAKKPTSLSMAQAAALPLVCITAWEALFEKIQLTPGQTVLIHAGAGGVGHVALQLAKWAGAHTYATVSSTEKADIAKSLGAIEAINYKNESVQQYVARLTNGKGFDVVLDTVGGDNIDKSLEAVALYGHVINILSTSSHDLTPLFLKSASFHVVFMLIPLLCNIQRERHGNILRRIATLCDQGVLKPLIEKQQFTFDQVSQAHALLESGKAFGKIVISRE